MALNPSNSSNLEQRALKGLKTSINHHRCSRPGQICGHHSTVTVCTAVLDLQRSVQCPDELWVIHKSNVVRYFLKQFSFNYIVEVQVYAKMFLLVLSWMAHDLRHLLAAKHLPVYKSTSTLDSQIICRETSNISIYYFCQETFAINLRAINTL